MSQINCRCSIEKAWHSTSNFVKGIVWYCDRRTHQTQKWQPVVRGRYTWLNNVKHIHDTYRICILDYVEFDVVEITHPSRQDSVEAEVSFGYVCAVSIASSSFVLHFQ